MAKRTRYIGEVRNHAYGKRQTSYSSWEFLKIWNKQIKTVQTETILKDKTSEKFFFFWRINKQYKTSKEEPWSRGTNWRLPFIQLTVYRIYFHEFVNLRNIRFPFLLCRREKHEGQWKEKKQGIGEQQGKKMTSHTHFNFFLVPFSRVSFAFPALLKACV